MQVTSAVASLPGVEDAAVVMATELNREILASSGMLVGDARQAGPNDLVVAVIADDDVAAESAISKATALLAERKPTTPSDDASLPPRSIRSAVRRATAQPNLAFVSVPGPYAAAEARQALLAGLHVLIFSDNVPLEDEVALKRLGRTRGLLVMGPDCGTAIVDGVGLGFANAVRAGRVGIVGASGTGMQEVSVLVHRLGEGVSQAIGTGGRDLHEAVGGSTTLHAIELLRDDPTTSAVLLVSKPPSPAVAEHVLQAAAAAGKPVVACLLGASPTPRPGVSLAPNLEEAARLAVASVAGGQAGFTTTARSEIPVSRLQAGQRFVRGLYCGGTLCDEAARAVGGDGHEFVDFGDDRYTRGRAHPMIDPTLRNQAIPAAGADPAVAVVLLDVILGHGAHVDPAGVVAPVIREARDRAAVAGRELAIFAHVLGTEGDPQDLRRQEETLRAAGAILFPSNYQAAVAAGDLVRGAAA